MGINPPCCHICGNIWDRKKPEADEMRNTGRFTSAGKGRGGGKAKQNTLGEDDGQRQPCASRPLCNDRRGVQRTADNESDVMRAEQARSPSPAEAAESVDPGTTRKRKAGPGARLLSSKVQGGREHRPEAWLAGRSFLLLPRRRRETTGLLTCDMMVKTARCYYFWLGAGQDETDPVKA